MTRSRIMLCTAAVIVAVIVGIAYAQPHLAESLVLHLDCTLEAPAAAPGTMIVRIHATDRISDAYYASPVDPEEGSGVTWQDDVPLTVDSAVPMRLIFHAATADGSPLPAGSAVRWQGNLDGAGFVDMPAASIVIPAGSSGDMTLVVRGVLVTQ